MNVVLAPPAVACTDKSGNSINSDPFEKTGDCFHFYQVSIIIFRYQHRIYQISQHFVATNHFFKRRKTVFNQPGHVLHVLTKNCHW